MNEKTDIDLYVYIDLNLEASQVELVKKCINLHIQTYYPYNILKFVCCNELVEPTSTEDVIKNGLFTFHNMFKRLKLKGKIPVWFMYISNGDIQDKYINKCVLLLNTQPNKKECYYTINETPFDLKNLTRDERVVQYKNLNDSLKHLLKQIDDENAKKISY